MLFVLLHVFQHCFAVQFAPHVNQAKFSSFFYYSNLKCNIFCPLFAVKKHVSSFSGVAVALQQLRILCLKNRQRFRDMSVHCDKK